jgi:hypothetical protein
MSHIGESSTAQIQVLVETKSEPSNRTGPLFIREPHHTTSRQDRKPARFPAPIAGSMGYRLLFVRHGPALGPGWERRSRAPTGILAWYACVSNAVPSIRTSTCLDRLGRATIL